MHVDFAHNPAFTVAVALAAGVLAQAVARHLSIPGIVILLGVGMLLGPEFAGLVHPQSLGSALLPVVGFAVAVILFEGGMNLDIRRLRREAGVIQRLVTLGGLMTAVGGTVAARWFMGWEWKPAILFGTLVMVTGPTVITPLLRRIGVNKNVHTVLEAEGVLIDAVGALVAVVALEVALGPPGQLAEGVAHLALRLGAGALGGLVGGAAMALVLRLHLLPHGLENVFTLAWALAVFQMSNALLPESGLMAVIVAGMVVGNAKVPLQRELLEFKEQLTVMLVGMLFVLLAAGVRLAELKGLGWAGLLTVAWLMVVVRPVQIAVCTWGSKLKPKERVFMAWMAPRGIVAAAVASLFAQTMERSEVGGGETMQALVFLVIAITVTVQGLTGGLFANLLGVRRPSDTGYLVMGANPLGRALGRALRSAGEEVVFIDANAHSARAAEEDGFRVIYGSALEDRTLMRAEPESRTACLGLTVNEGVNLLFARRCKEEFKAKRVMVAVHRGKVGVSTQTVGQVGGTTLFGAPRDLDFWVARFARSGAVEERWALDRGSREKGAGEKAEPFPETLILPLVTIHGERAIPYDDRLQPKPADQVVFLLSSEKLEDAREWLRSRGWTPSPREETQEASTLSPAPEAG